MQIPESKLETVRGKVIGIGRVKIPKMSNFNYEIPLLSFVVIRKPDGGYVSSCIHLQMDGYGDSDKDAQIDMVGNILDYLDENFNGEYHKEHCWTNILGLFEANERTSTLWDTYHAFQIMLAEKGHATDRYSSSQQLKEIVRKIDELENRVKALEGRIKNLEEQRRKGNGFTGTLKDMEKDLIVQYNDYKEAA